MNSVVSGTGAEGDTDDEDGEGAEDAEDAEDADREEAADVLRPSGEPSPDGVIITNAATATRIAAPRKAMSQRTFRTLPFS
ncbi:hypothetical protein ACLQ2R_02255 [Streptosporangium sp. DT93]|uniref:hypothetical protein n=1 Tax=Streptosporangium sp. DT93 TaxID=3393428 RepID=UPI003CF686A8